MSDFVLYSEEKEKIDNLLKQGYRVIKVSENLSGMFIKFQLHHQVETLQLLTAEARKYMSVQLKELITVS